MANINDRIFAWMDDLDPPQNTALDYGTLADMDGRYPMIPFEVVEYNDSVATYPNYMTLVEFLEDLNQKEITPLLETAEDVSHPRVPFQAP